MHATSITAFDQDKTEVQTNSIPGQFPPTSLIVSNDMVMEEMKRRSGTKDECQARRPAQRREGAMATSA
jgi:hypothetical protein